MRLIQILIIYTALLSVSSCHTEHQKASDDTNNLYKTNIGFYNPSMMGISDDFAHKIHSTMINVYSVEQLEANLLKAQSLNIKVMVDFSLLLTTSKDALELQTEYINRDGVISHKVLKPGLNIKVLKFKDEISFINEMSLYIPLLYKYRDYISYVFLADEPYLNGITKLQMEQALHNFKKSLVAYNSKFDLKFGVIFAAGMFDANFASMLNKKAIAYVDKIDGYYWDQVHSGKEETPEFKAWLGKINKIKLKTYEQAGNMYIDGGVPAGFDLVGFDFYLSTMLLDTIYVDSLSFFASNETLERCKRFKDKSILDVRSDLYFFGGRSTYSQDSSTQEESLSKELLDDAYECRMQYLMNKLEIERSKMKKPFDILMLSESSPTGVFDFDSDGNKLMSQNKIEIERRLNDEVLRALRYYEQQKIDKHIAALMFFTYDNQYDISINQRFEGTAAFPEIFNVIANAAK